MARLVCILLFGLFLSVCGKEALVAQTLGLTSPKDFRRCTEGDTQEFKLKVTQISDKAGFKENSFSLDWGDGTEGVQNVAYDALNAVHTYTKWNVFQLKITAVTHSGGDKGTVLSGGEFVQTCCRAGRSPNRYFLCQCFDGAYRNKL